MPYVSSQKIMDQRKTTILLTGFGPFPGVPDNASARLVVALYRLAAQALPDADVHTDILPTEWVLAPARLRQLLSDLKPDLALHFGVSAAARGFEIETRATNAAGCQKDGTGELAQKDYLQEGGLDVLPVRLPALDIVRRLRDLNLPAHVSTDAGSYICNAVLYHSLAHAEQRDTDMRAGFVHLPVCLADIHDADPKTQSGDAGIGTNGCPLNWPGGLTGSLDIIKACLGHIPQTSAEGRPR